MKLILVGLLVVALMVMSTPAGLETAGETWPDGNGMIAPTLTIGGETWPGG
jgi:hypothetical protein